MIDFSKITGMDILGHQVSTVDKENITLTPREMDLVLVCIEGINTVSDAIDAISRRDITRGRAVEGVKTLSDQSIANLRKNLRVKLGEDVVPVGKKEKGKY